MRAIELLLLFLFFTGYGVMGLITKKAAFVYWLVHHEKQPRLYWFALAIIWMCAITMLICLISLGVDGEL